MANQNLEITFDVVPCELGFLLAAKTSLGLCAVRLGEDATALANTLRQEYAGANITRNADALRPETQTLLQHLAGEQRVLDLALDLRGTDFQREVWRTLQTVPYGETRTYTQLAEMMSKPQAVRAVASACAANGIALAVPCHRIVRRDGSESGFRWSLERKAALLRRERETCGNEPAQALLFAIDVR